MLNVALPKLATGIVVRPSGRGGCGGHHAVCGRCSATDATHACDCCCRLANNANGPQTLVFLGDEIRLLLPLPLLSDIANDDGDSDQGGNGNSCTASDGCQQCQVGHKNGNGCHQQCQQQQQQQAAAFRLSEQPLAVHGASLGTASCPTYEPTTDSVIFAEGGTAIMCLHANNAVSLVAGRRQRDKQPASADGGRGADGHGSAARFENVFAMAADGKGNVFIADGGGPSRIRLLNVGSGAVTTARQSAPVSYYWTALAYDTMADVLVAATHYGLCHLPVYGISSPCGPVTSPRLVAGRWNEDGGATSDVARFHTINCVLAAAGGCLIFEQLGVLRQMDASEVVTHLLATDLRRLNCPRQAVFLPGGQLAVCGYRSSAEPNGLSLTVAIVSGGGGGGCFAPASTILAGWVAAADAAAPAALSSLLLAGGGDESDDDGGAAAAAADAVVAVRTGRKATFVAHRSVLAARSAYFRRLLDPAGGGFADSGATEVLMPDVDPEVFGVLLVYMYTGELVVPDELLHPAAELAGRLLMPADCCTKLQARLLAGVTPGSVISELVWAQRHSLTLLVPQLKVFLLRNRKQVAAAAAADPGGLLELAAVCPEIAAELLLKSLAV
ncbi:Ankyrin repeat and BTB/POZ domain-containing protein 1 [Pleodorina starrii]|nr:Ankyrin repeat and BTB/POZ domain-containing protein 1 [Pleodorina starrii]